MQSDDFENHLTQTLVTRPLIEQAKGVLALALCSTPQQAFADLRRASREHGVRLQDLAAALVDAAAGRTPGDPQLRKVIWHEWGNEFPNC